MLPTTVDRVPANTDAEINRRIAEQTERNVAWYGSASDEAIERRLHELDQEWDIERTLEANAATVAMIGLGMGAFVDKRFLALPAVVAGFLFQHAVQGWCPPLPVLRRLGFRTQYEIEQERYALKALRGDFQDVSDPAQPTTFRRPQMAVSAVRR